MVRVKSQAQIKANYSGAIPRVAEAYKQGVQGTTGWQDAAIRAESLYQAKMQESMAENRRAKGLGRVTDEQWKQAAANTGAARIGQGMSAAVDKQAGNFEPYRSALEGLTLPDKVADPMANVDNRLKKVVQTMVDTKKGQ